MPIFVTCECGKQFETGDEYAGRRAHCPNCGRDLIIPVPGEPPLAPLEPREAPDGELEAQDSTVIGSSRAAIVSLSLGITSLICSCTLLMNLLAGIPALILGIKALTDIDKSHGRLKGRGMAITGIVTGGMSCALIPVAIGLLMPAVQAAREAANRAVCTNQLKEIGVALHNFESARGHFPPPSITDADGRPLLSWRVAILPYIGQQPLYREFKLDEPWDSAHNKALLPRMPRTFHCPSDPSAGGTATRYQVIVGPGTAFEGTRGVRLTDIIDGPSNTLFVVEARTPVPWTMPDGLPFKPDASVPALGSRHPLGENALFGDGVVHFLRNSIPPEVLRALITRAGGEIMPRDAY